MLLFEQEQFRVSPYSIANTTPGTPKIDHHLENQPLRYFMSKFRFLFFFIFLFACQIL